MLGEVLTAIVTPFREDGTVDFHRFAALAHYLLEHGSDGIVVAGTTGESPTLSEDERLELFRVAVGAVGEQATVIAGTGTYSTAESMHFTEQAHEIGVDGFLVVTPYYSKPPQRGIVEHFKAIASVSDRPVIVYNIPGRVVINIEPETMAKLAEIENVRAVKQANDDLHQARFIVEETGLDLYAGDDNIVFPFLELGGMGGVCVHTHVVGPRVKEMIRLYKAGDHVEARRIDEELEAVVRPAEGGDEPDRDQGRAQPPRARGGRPAAAAGRGDGRPARAGAELPGPAGPRGAGPGLALASPCSARRRSPYLPPPCSSGLNLSSRRRPRPARRPRRPPRGRPAPPRAAPLRCASARQPQSSPFDGLCRILRPMLLRLSRSREIFPGGATARAAGRRGSSRALAVP